MLTCQVRHANGAVVIEGKTSAPGREVECELWFVNEGALFVGEQYTFVVPRGNGFVETEKGFLVGHPGSDAAVAHLESGMGATVVELSLTREYASVSRPLTNPAAPRSCAP